MTDVIPTEQKIQIRLVDFGIAVAKIRKDRSCVNFDGSPNPFTTLTLMTPAYIGDSGYEPPSSCVISMSEDQLKALIEALS